MTTENEYQMDLFRAEVLVRDLDLTAVIRSANEERSAYFAKAAGYLWGKFTGLFATRYKAIQRHYRLQNEIFNMDERVLGDIGVSRWELPSLVRGAISSQADVSESKKLHKSAEIMPLFSLMRAEASRKERHNSDHPMAA
jgi:uncharacterized protein YjiS (DUF1127 family)